MRIRIDRESSEIKFVYNDKLRALLDEGDALTVRASNVEPAQDGSWLADLRSVNGPVLTGFRLRSEALAAEVAWINANIIDSSEPLEQEV